MINEYELVRSIPENDYGWIVMVLTSLRREQKISHEEEINLMESLSI